MGDLAHGLENRVLAYTLGRHKPSTPGCLDEVIDRLALKIEFRELPPGVSGRTWYTRGRPKIEIDPHTSLRRANFTTAHEIGHVLVDQWRQNSRAPTLLPDKDSAEEILCDRIAAELLMPTSWARTRAAITEPPYLRGLIDVADDAHVTLAAASSRMRYLGLKVRSWQLMRSNKLTPNWSVVHRSRSPAASFPSHALLERLDDFPENIVTPVDPRASFEVTLPRVRAAAVVVRWRSAFLVAG